MSRLRPIAEAPSVRIQLTSLANRVDRLTIDRRDPEQFFLVRSEIVAELHRLARAVETSA